MVSPRVLAINPSPIEETEPGNIPVEFVPVAQGLDWLRVFI